MATMAQRLSPPSRATTLSTIYVAARDDAKARLGLTFRDKGFGLTTGDLAAVSRLAEAWEAGQ